MTSTMPQNAAAPADRTLRTLTISVNLLPTEVVDARRTRHLQRTVLAAFAGFIVLVGAWYAFASFQTMSAQNSLEAAQDKAARLISQQKKFAKLSSVQAESHAIDAQLKSLFADDLQWADLMGDVNRVAPAGVQVSGVSGNLRSGSTAPGGAAGAPSALPNASGKRLVGSVTITGAASSKAAIANYVDALGKVAGLASPLLSGVNVEDKAAHFTITADVTESALGGRYTPAKSAKPKGGK